MNKRSGSIILGAILVSLSFLIYAIHFFVFKDMHHILIYLVGDIAFVPFEVLLVTLILHRVLDAREKNILKKKLNMVIGLFFNEIGTDLLKNMSAFAMDFEDISLDLLVRNNWSQKKFSKVLKKIKRKKIILNLKKSDLNNLKSFLHDKRMFILTLLANPNLLEHESFTDLLWAVFHLLSELDERTSLDDLLEGDMKHLRGDMHRALTLLLFEWMQYMRHLKTDYPYLFSLALRTNPFDAEVSVIVQ